MAANNIEFQFSLLALPTELIICVLQHVERISDLLSLSRTSSRLQELTEPLLYRKILLRKGKKAELIVRSLISRPKRAIAVRDLDIACQSGHRQSFGPAGIAGILRLASRLSTLSFESPCNSTYNFESHGPWTSMFDSFIRPFEDAAQRPAGAFAAGPLMCLKELTIHMNGPGSPFWRLDDRGASILLLPALERLKISCVIIDDTSLSSIKKAAFSPLKILDLEEVNITLGGLRAILSMPIALETLSLQEDVHNCKAFFVQPLPTWNSLFQKDPEETMKCVEQQRGSLKCFAYGTRAPVFGGRLASCDSTPVDGAFADFPMLEAITLKVDGACPSFERAVCSSRPPLALKHLEYEGPASFWSASPNEGIATTITTKHLPFFRAPASTMPPDLRTVRITHSKPSARKIEPTSAEGRNIRAVAAELHKVGKIVLEVSMLDTGSFFPPILHGEPIPKHISIFRDGHFQQEYLSHQSEAQLRTHDGESDSESDSEPDSEPDYDDFDEDSDGDADFLDPENDASDDSDDGSG